MGGTHVPPVRSNSRRGCCSSFAVALTVGTGWSVRRLRPVTLMSLNGHRSRASLPPCYVEDCHRHVVITCSVVVGVIVASWVFVTPRTFRPYLSRRHVEIEQSPRRGPLAGRSAGALQSSTSAFTRTSVPTSSLASLSVLVSLNLRDGRRSGLSAVSKKRRRDPLYSLLVEPHS